MNIKTKFDVYDEVFFIVNKKSAKYKVRGIKIEVMVAPGIEIWPEITYLVGGDDPEERVFIKVLEKDAYATKEELLQSI